MFAPPRAAGERQSIVADVVLGARALRGHPVAVRLVGADVVCSVVYGMQTVLLLLLCRSLGFGDAGYGYVLAGLGAGGILGTTLAGRAARSARPRAVLAGALLVLAVPSSLMAVTPWLPGLLVWSVLGGAGAVAGRGALRDRAAAGAGRGGLRPRLRRRAAGDPGRHRRRLAGRGAAGRAGRA